MRISARCDYACKALLELTLHWPSKEPLQLHTISENQGISTKYLVHILIQLKRMGLIESIRGKQGGTRAVLKGRKSYRTNYTMRSAQYGEATFDIGVVRKQGAL